MRRPLAIPPAPSRLQRPAFAHEQARGAPYERVSATFGPGKGSQVLGCCCAFEDFVATYGRLHRSGMRLRLQHAYEMGGQTRYDGVWQSGTQEERAVWAWPDGDFPRKTAELASQGMRLVQLQSFLSVGGQTRVAAVWNAGSVGQRFALGMAADALRERVAELGSRGLRISSLVSSGTPEGRPSYDVVWDRTGPEQACLWQASGGEFQAAQQALATRGFAMRLVSTHLLDGEVRYDGVWDRTQVASELALDVSRDEMRRLADQQLRRRRLLTSVTVLRC